MAIWQEIRFGFSQIRRSPLTAFAAVTAIALGIGANAAMFSVIDGFLWKPLKFPNGNRLLLFHEQDKLQPEYVRSGFSALAFERWRNASTSLELVSAFSIRTSTLGTALGLESRQHTQVTGDFFACIGAGPQIGRILQPRDTAEGRGQIVVLSDRLWRTSFNADPSIVGQTIAINEVNHEVVGIMPVNFDYPQRTDFWTPAAWTAGDRTNRTNQRWTGIALLKPSARLAAAAGELNAVSAELARQYPAEQGARYSTIGPLREKSNSTLTKQYSMLSLYSSLFVLLIACTNVANLQFTQAAARRGEIAVRMSLGASRWDILRMLLVQSTIIAIIGAAFGLLLSFWWLDLVVKSMPPEVERFVMGWSEIQIDLRTLTFVLLLACASGILSGVMPAWRSGGWNFAGTLREAGRSGSSGRGTMRLRVLLIVLQLSASIVLLTGAGLMIKGFNQLLNRTNGLNADRVLVSRVELPLRLYGQESEIRSKIQAIQREAQAQLQTTGIAIVDHVPFSQARDTQRFYWAGEARPQTAPQTNVINATSAYAELAGARLIDGRWITAADSANNPRIAIVSETFAKQFSGSSSGVIGRELSLGEQPETYRIAGIVSDVHDNSYESGHPAPVVYRSLEQAPSLKFDVMVAVPPGTDPLSLSPSLREVVSRAAPGAVLGSSRTFDKVIRDERVGFAYIASMLAVLGLIAIILAAVGLFALVAFSVSERSKEFGIRMATGATPANILTLVLRDGLTYGFGGLLIGVPISAAVARLISGLLFGVQSHDLWVFSSVILGFLGVVLLASLAPAARAARIAPLTILQRQ